MRLAECRHTLPPYQTTRPIAGIIESSLKFRRVAVTDHVLAWCKKNKIASIEWNSSADNALLSALGGKALPLWHRPLARR
jgi:hypothetical protein